MKKYLINYSRYFLILGVVIIALRMLGIEVSRLDSLPEMVQYVVGAAFCMLGLIGTRLKSVTE